MTFIRVAVATIKLIFGTYDCMVHSNIGTGDFSLVQVFLLVCRHAHVLSHVSASMDW